VSKGGALRIALPGLAGGVRRCVERGEDVRLPAAEWLVARGHPEATTVPAWREWLLAGAGLGADVLERFPAGPCCRAVHAGMRSAGTWACAEPVHLLTALDHLQLAAPVPVPLDAAESAALLATLNGHLAGSGFVLHASSGGGWLCSCPPDLHFGATEPSDALGQNLRDVLPTGRDAVRVRAVVNELQMLLHEHPVNDRRAARGQPTVNSVWLWGLGATAEPRGVAPGLLLTDDDWLTGLWRLHGGGLRTVEEFARVLSDEEGVVRIALAPSVAEGGEVEALRQMERTVLAPARAALAAARVGSIALHVGSTALEVPANARWTFWRRPRPLARVMP